MTLKKYLKNSFTKKSTKKIPKSEKLYNLQEIIMKVKGKEVFEEGSFKNTILNVNEENNIRDIELRNNNVRNNEIYDNISRDNSLRDNVRDNEIDDIEMKNNRSRDNVRDNQVDDIKINDIDINDIEKNDIEINDNRRKNPIIFQDNENIKTFISENNEEIKINKEKCFKNNDNIKNKSFYNQIYSNIILNNQDSVINKECKNTMNINQYNNNKIDKDQVLNNEFQYKLKNENKMLEIFNSVDLETNSIKEQELIKKQELSKIQELSKKQDQDKIQELSKNQELNKNQELSKKQDQDKIHELNKKQEESLKERRTKIQSLKEVPLLPCPIYTKLYLPEIFKKMIKLYNSLLTVYRFNKDKGLNTIFIKSLKSIEDMCNFKVSQSFIEQLYYISRECFIFRKVKIQHFSKYVDSFTFECLKDKNYFNQSVYKYYRNTYKNNEIIPRKSLFEKEIDKSIIF
ncbi:hypothetical protein CWI39_3038p0010, partial [Hamiltosporidium magnivora]